MRVAYDAERDTLAGAAAKAGSSLSMLFVYGASREAAPARFALAPISADLSTLCRKVCATVRREQQ